MGVLAKECYQKAFVFKLINQMLTVGKTACVLMLFLLLYAVYEQRIEKMYLLLPFVSFFSVMIVHYFILSLLGFQPFVIGMMARKTLGTMSPEKFEKFLFQYWATFPYDILNCVVVMTNLEEKSHNLRFCFDKDIDTESMTGRVKAVRFDERDDMFTVDLEVIHKGV